MVHIQPKVRLFYSDQWNDETGSVRHGEGFRIGRGLASEGSRSRPTELAFTLDNEVGRFSVADPSSPLFGLLGRNNPVMVSIPGGGMAPNAGNADGAGQSGGTSSSTSHVAPAVTSRWLPDPSLLVCCWLSGEFQFAGDYTVPGSMTAGVETDATATTMRAAWEAVTAGTTTTRTATHSVSDRWAALTVLVRGDGATPVVEEELSDVLELGAHNNPATLNTGAGTQKGWWLLAIRSNSSIEQLVYDPEAEVPEGGGWFEVADSVDLSTTIPHLRAWVKRVDSAGAQAVTFPPTTTSDEVHLRVLVLSGAGPNIRATAELVSMPPRRDNSGNDRWVPVEAAGILRRLGASTAEPLDPALTRATSVDPAVVAYWPLADLGQNVTRAPSPLDGVGPAAVRPTTSLAFDVAWSADQRGTGLGAMPTVRSEQSGVGLTGQIPAGIGDRFGWSMWGRGEGDSIASNFTMWIDTDSTLWLLWVLWETPTFNDITIIVQATDADGVLLADLSNTNTIPFDDRWHQFAAIVEQVGSDADLTVLMDGEEVSMSLNSGSLSGLTVGAPRQARPTGSITTSAGRGMSIGYPTVLGSSTAETIDAVQRLYTAGIGHDGEPAGLRFLRLCQEEGIGAAVVGDPDTTVMMGPQRTATLLELLHECEDADHGILFEPQEFVGLTYRTVGNLYNQTAVATLDFTNGEVAAPWEPTPDDRLIRNDVTVTRRGGGSARSIQESGPLNVGDPGTGDPEAVGRYRHDPTISLTNDVQTPGQAGWLRLLGTQPEARFPSIAVNLLREQVLSLNPALVEALASLDVGDKIIVQNPAPGDLPPDDVEQLWVGSDELLTQVDWELAGNTVPAAPYTIGVLDDPVLGVLQSDAAILGEDLTTTETDVGIVLGAGPDWVHEGTDYDILVAGERMTVTAVAAATGTFPNRTQVLTVVRSVNGVVKSHPVSPQPPVEIVPRIYIGL